MPTKSIKKRWSTVSLLLLAYCSFGLMGPEGLVLCLGQDGHVAVEAAPSGIYCGFVADTSEVGEQLRLADMQTPESHCGVCRDTALLLDSVRVGSKRDLVYPMANLAFVVMPSFYLVSDSFSTKINRLFCKDSFAAVPSFLRTTILLI